MNNKIIIFNTLCYCGGTLVLSQLCKSLRELGYDARLYLTLDFMRQPHDAKAYYKEIVKYNIKNYVKNKFCKWFPKVRFFDRYRPKDVTSVSMSGLKFQVWPFWNKDKTIVIYPEDLYGNPLYAKKVVRWFLYYYRYENTPEAYGKDDMFIAYRETFNSKILNPHNDIVYQAVFNSDLYHQYNFGKREGNCYILRKGRTRNDLPSSFEGPVYDDNMSQKELVKMFNEHQYCYSYDLQTFYTIIAAVCGCIPINVMEPGKTEADYLDSGQIRYGQAMGNTPEQIQFAIDTRDKLLKSLDYSERNRKNALHLIELLTQRFGEIKKQLS